MQLLILLLLIIFLPFSLVFYFYQKYRRELVQKGKLQQQIKKFKEQIEILENNIKVSPDEQIIKTLIEHLPSGLILTDEKGLVRYINPAAQTFLGYSLSQLLEQNIQQFVKLWESQQNEVSVVDLLTKFRSGIIEFRIGSKSIRLHTQIVRYDKANGTTCLWVLDSPVETDAELTKMQSFYSRAAHDLKTPITVVKNIIELLLDKNEQLDQAKQKELLLDGKSQTELLQNLVEDILNIARLEQGKIQPNIEPVSVNSIVLRAISKHNLFLKKKGLGLEFDASASSGLKVMADAYLFQIIVDNLLSNAIKYTFQGMISITVTTRNSHVWLNVTDSGVGIDQVQQRLLFKIYQSIGEARKLPAEKSTGLGLYIAREMARLMKGDVFLSATEPGKGSTFTLQLPIA